MKISKLKRRQKLLRIKQLLVSFLTKFLDWCKIFFPTKYISFGHLQNGSLDLFTIVGFRSQKCVILGAQEITVKCVY